MTGWVEYVLVAVLCAVDLAVLRGVRRVAQARQAATRRVWRHQLDELDQRPEFALSPPDWPIRESPPKQAVAARLAAWR